MGRFTGILGLLAIVRPRPTPSPQPPRHQQEDGCLGPRLQVAFAIFVLKIEIGRVLSQKAWRRGDRSSATPSPGSQFVLEISANRARTSVFILHSKFCRR